MASGLCQRLLLPSRSWPKPGSRSAASRAPWIARRFRLPAYSNALPHKSVIARDFNQRAKYRLIVLVALVKSCW
jgi:hypothetical protein